MTQEDHEVDFSTIVVVVMFVYSVVTDVCFQSRACMRQLHLTSLQECTIP